MQSKFAQDVVDFVGTPMWRIVDCGKPVDTRRHERFSLWLDTSWNFNVLELSPS